MKADLTLIVGASGTVGSELARLLKAQGQRVRLTTSQEITPGETEKVRVDLSTGAGVEKAFEGVTKAFLLSPPGYADQYKILSPLIRQAQKHGLKKVVLMTAMGVNANDANPFRRAELELEASGLDFHILRPNWFFQNFNTFWIQGMREQGKILVPAGTAKTSFIDARDISEVAAKLLMGATAPRTLDLTGPQALDHDDVAAEISRASGAKIVYQEITPEAFRSAFVKAGVPADYVEVLLAIFGFLREGYQAPVTTSVKDLLGREPRDLKTYAADFRASWI